MFLPASDPLIHSSLGAPAPALSARVLRCGKAAGASGWSATFLGQMYALEGAQRMAMRVTLEERQAGSRTFTPVYAPGLGGWHPSAPSVRVFRYLAQVTSLTGPADYRALIDFRWLALGGRVLRAARRRTPECAVPAAVAGTRRSRAALPRARSARGRARAALRARAL